MAVFINFNMINVVTLNTNASVSVGENNQVGWDSHQKQNSGIGPINGFSYSVNILDIIFDNDLVDIPINDPDIKPGVQIQTV